MIKLFKATDKTYTSNGDIVLQTTKAKVHKEDNGDFYINIEAPLSENEKSVSAIAGTTVEGNSFTLNNVDPSKEYSYFFKGNSNEIVTGRQVVSVAGKNFLPSINTTRTINGITFTHNADGSITANGTATDNAIYPINIDSTTITRNVVLENGTYIFNDGVGDYTNYFCQITNGTNYYNSGTGGGIGKTPAINVSNSNPFSFVIYVRNGKTLNNVVFKPQLEKGNTPSSYEEYKGGNYEINLGKNLANINVITSISNPNLTRTIINDTIVLSGNTNTSGYATMERKLSQICPNLQVGDVATLTFNTTYTTKFIYLAGTGANMTWNTGTKKTITQAMLDSTIICYGGYNTTTTISNFQIEKGDATSYTPYKTPIELTDSQEKIYKDNNIWFLDKLNNEEIETTQLTDQDLISQLESIKLLKGINNISIIGYPAITMNLKYNYRNAKTTKINYIDYLIPNNIIVANTPQGDQAFRITNVENTRTKIKIKAYHVFYDSKNYLIQDSYVVDKNCNDALDHLNSSTDNASPFTTISDITKIASYRCVRKSLYEAIQVLLERYGGHLVRDNWTIGIRNSIGQDNGVMIHYGKNLKDIKATYNWDNVVTKLMPVGKDGILLNALDPTNDVYLESQTQYDIPYTKTVTFDQNNIVEDDYKDDQGEVDTEAYTQALLNDLAEQGQNYLATNSIPVVNYTLSANVEKVSDIGDTIQVVDEKLGINILTNIISYEYDCVLDKYTQLEFGNFVPTLSGLVSSITSQTQQIVDESTATLQITLGKELQDATNQIWNALGNSYVIYEGDKILVVDSLPKETATNVIMINNGGIGFSNSGINGQFNSAWTIDNVLNMEQINVINLTADLIKGGTLKLGSNLNQNGQLEVYDEANSLIAELNKNGLKMYGVDGSYILMNNTVGFSGYDRLGNQIYWVSKDEFHMKKSVVEEEITLCNKMRFIPITITDGNNNIVNDGIGLVSVAGGGN